MIRKFGLGLTFLALFILGPQVRADQLSAQATATITAITNYSNYVEVDMSLTGSGTPIGSFTGSATYFWDYAANGMGMGTISTANGNINFDADGGIDPNGNLVGNYTIVGGTGQYSNATGAGTITGTANGQSSLNVTLSGTINYTNGNQLSAQATGTVTNITRFPNYVEVDMSLTGSGIPIGSFTGSATYFWDYGANGMGMGTMSTANGTINFDFNGGIDPNGNLLGNYTIMGGTGLYSNATGSGTITGTANGNTLTVTLSGTINYPTPSPRKAAKQSVPDK